MQEQNKRRFPRLEASIQTEYAILDKTTVVRQGKTKDISIGGLSILTSELLAKGEFLDIKFFLPNDKIPIEAISKVVWSREAGSMFETGIEFVKINFKDQERISVFMHNKVKP